MKKLFKKQKNINQNSGFAMIFTVLIMSLILSITLGMSNIVFKQRILSGLVRDSQIAFYQADTGSECGLLQDFKLANFRNGIITDTNNPNYNEEFLCGDKTMRYNPTESNNSSIVPTPNNNYFVYQQVSPNPNLPCYTIVFDKRFPGTNVIDSRGYNICGTNIRQVERGIKVSY